MRYGYGYGLVIGREFFAGFYILLFFLPFLLFWIPFFYTSFLDTFYFSAHCIACLHYGGRGHILHLLLSIYLTSIKTAGGSGSVRLPFFLTFFMTTIIVAWLLAAGGFGCISN